MKLPIWKALLPVTLMTLAGCIPAEFVEVPALRGRVVDSDHRPAPNATLRITARFGAYPPLRFSARPDGTFASPEQSRFCLIIPGADLAWPDYSLIVFSSTGQSYPIDIPSGFRMLFLFGPPRAGVNLGDVQVH